MRKPYLWLPLVVACTTVPVASTTSEASAALQPVEIEGAVNLRVATGPDDAVWVVSTEGSRVVLREVDAISGTLGEPISVTENAMSHPLEQPALTIGSDRGVEVAWISADGRVNWAAVSQGQMTGPEVVSGPTRPETALVQMIPLAGGGSLISWLEDSSLSVALPGSGTRFIERENVDDLTCDCCHPVPIQIGDEFGIGYRDLERTGEGDQRDIRFLTGTVDGTFVGEPIEVADDPWIINACPLSGPALALRDDEILITWMDARQTLHPDQTSNSIWFDLSSDEGRSFGVDQMLTDEAAVYGRPAMAVGADGVIHLVWEKRTEDIASLQYLKGDGTIWSPVEDLMVSDRAPQQVSIASVDEILILAWVDGANGYLAFLQQ